MASRGGFTLPLPLRWILPWVHGAKVLTPYIIENDAPPYELNSSIHVSSSICVEEFMRARDRRGDGTWSPPGVRAIQLQVIAILLAQVYRLKSAAFSR